MDLLGAAFGCLILMLLPNHIDASSARFVVAAMASLAGAVFTRHKEKPRRLTCYLAEKICSDPVSS